MGGPKRYGVAASVRLKSNKATCLSRKNISNTPHPVDRHLRVAGGDENFHAVILSRSLVTRRGLGKQPSFSTDSRNGGISSTTVEAIRQTVGTCSLATSPRKTSVTCKFSRSVHLTSQPVRASSSCKPTSRSRIGLLNSTAMKV